MKESIDLLVGQMTNVFDVRNIRTEFNLQDKQIKNCVVYFIHTTSVRHEAARQFVGMSWHWQVKDLAKGLVQQSFTWKV